MLRVRLKSKESASLVGFAKKKHRELAQLRERAKAPVLQKSLTVGDTQIKLYSSAWDNYVELSGQGSYFPHMVLSDSEGTYLYNYEKNQRSKIARSIGRLFRGSTGLVRDAASLVLYVVSGKQVSKKKLSPFLSFLDHFRSNRSFSLQGRDLYVYDPKRGEEQAVASLPVRSYAADALTSTESHISVLGEGADNLWNRSNGAPDLSMIGVLDGAPSAGSAWRWYPRIWNPTLANGLFLHQGLYYGSPLGAYWGPCKRVEARFLGMLDNRGGSTLTGYAEILLLTDYQGSDTEDDGEQKHAKVFFIPELWEPSRAIYYQEERGWAWFQNDYWEGCPAPEFQLYVEDIFPEGSKQIELSWWSLRDIPPPDFSVAPPRKHYGVVLFIPGGAWGFFRYSGFSREVKSGTGYIDHSYSADGRIVTILYAQAGETRVFVFDMEFEDAEGRTPGKQLVDQEVVGALPYVSGKLISKSKREPTLRVTAPGVVSSDRDGTQEPSLFGMTHAWPVAPGNKASGWKVEVDGRDGVGFKWEDDCWQQAKYTRWYNADFKANVFGSTNLIMAGAPLGQHGTVGGFSGSGEKLHPTAGGASNTKEGSIVVERARVKIYRDHMTGCMVATPNVKHPFEFSGDVKKVELPNIPGVCYQPVIGCSDEDGVPSAKIRMQDACGETAEATILGAPLSIRGPSVFLEGEVFSASGGAPPYTFSSNCGAVNAETGEVTDDSSCCETPENLESGEYNGVKVTVSDSCGRTASMISRGKVGMWVTTVGNSPAGQQGYVGVYQTTDSGTTRTTVFYSPCGCECAPEPFVYPGGCTGRENTYCNNPSTGDVTIKGSICDASPSTPSHHTLAGTVGTYVVNEDSGFCYVYSGNEKITYGWQVFCLDPEYIVIQKWMCP